LGSEAYAFRGFIGAHAFKSFPSGRLRRADCWTCSPEGIAGLAPVAYELRSEEQFRRNIFLKSLETGALILAYDAPAEISRIAIKWNKSAMRWAFSVLLADVTKQADEQALRPEARALDPADETCREYLGVVDRKYLGRNPGTGETVFQ
jgi:hypothetical protein